MLHIQCSRVRMSPLPARMLFVMLAAGTMIFVVAGVSTKAALAADAKSDGGDEADRAMAFVEKSVRATDLYNQRKLPEALAVFQELTQKYKSLDEDGYVAMGLADCLHAMGHNDEARQVYQAVAAEHADLKATASMRIREIDLAGAVVSDSLIEELRQAVQTAGDNRVPMQLQLGRALQKRAEALLKEAVATFRTAAEENRDLASPASRTISHQAVILAEIQDDLASLVERVEKTWGLARTLGEIVDSGSLERDGDASITDYHAEWTTDVSGRRRANIQAEWKKNQGSSRITVDGRAIKLNSTQTLLIQRHQQRINAIIQEALQAEQAQTAGAK